MTIKLATAVRNAAMTAIKNALDAGSGNGILGFYSLPLPATTGAAITTQTLLSSCELSKPCGTVNNGVLTFDPIGTDLAADGTGTIAFVRLTDSEGNFVADCDVGVAGSGAMFILNTLSTIAGGAVQIISCTLTEGNP
jgi:hypothetical protein